MSSQQTISEKVRSSGRGVIAFSSHTKKALYVDGDVRLEEPYAGHREFKNMALDLEASLRFSPIGHGRYIVLISDRQYDPVRTFFNLSKAVEECSWNYKNDELRASYAGLNREHGRWYDRFMGAAAGLGLGGEDTISYMRGKMEKWDRDLKFVQVEEGVSEVASGEDSKRV